jgi:AraC family transcriptional regulator
MATSDPNSQQLKAGEHYGSVSNKTRLSSAIVSESVYQKTLCLPEHSHELGFFTLILDGQYSEVIRGRDVFYTPQTVLWRQAETSHKDKIEVKRSRFFFVEIERAYTDKLRMHGPVPDRLAERNGSLTWLASRLRNEIINGESSSPLIAEGITLEMLGHLTLAKKFGDKRPPHWVVRVAERLNEEFGSSLSNEELANEAGVHPVHLASVFRRFYGENIGEFVQRLRVERASVLLNNLEMPLTDIAYECGFSDQSHFSRVFKRRTGLTPGAFRSSSK